MEIPAPMQCLFYAISSMHKAVFIPQPQKWFATNVTAQNIFCKNLV
jgi:hypothetical protein